MIFLLSYGHLTGFRAFSDNFCEVLSDEVSSQTLLYALVSMSLECSKMSSLDKCSFPIMMNVQENHDVFN